MKPSGAAHDGSALPTFVAHADWGTQPAKRQVAVAHLSGSANGHYVIDSIKPADPSAIASGDLRRGLGIPDGVSSAILGFDLPLGLPRAYADRVGVTSFLEFLDGLGEPPWEDVIHPATHASEIALHRPFYPYRPGGTSRQHLTDALGLSSQQLRRLCEGSDAETIFWTLGGKQVGKAAISGWVLLHQALSSGSDIGVWPFDGNIAESIRAHEITVVETYPREFYRWAAPEWPLGSQRWSKTRKEDRQLWAASIATWVSELGMAWTDDVRDMAYDGFGSDSNGEDRFDALIGLLGMIAVVTGALDSGVPSDDPAVVSVEGWILGRTTSM